MQMYDINSKRHVRKNLRDIIYCDTGVHFYSTPVPEHYKTLCLDRLHGSTYINYKHRKNNENKITWFLLCASYQLHGQIAYGSPSNEYVHLTRLNVKRLRID